MFCCIINVNHIVLFAEIAMLKYLIILLTGLTMILVQEEDHCIWYGVCHKDDFERKFNCPYNGSGYKLEDQKAIKTLKRFCPELNTDRNASFFIHMYKFFVKNSLTCNG